MRARTNVIYTSFVINSDSRVDIERGSGVAATITLRQYYIDKESPVFAGPTPVQLGYDTLTLLFIIFDS